MFNFQLEAIKGKADIIQLPVDHLSTSLKHGAVVQLLSIPKSFLLDLAYCEDTIYPL